MRADVEKKREIMRVKDRKGENRQGEERKGD